MFMLNDASIINPFNSDYFFWLDGGITSTVHPGYFIKDKVLHNLPNYIDSIDNKFLHLVYPYEGNEEIHGFERKSMANYCSTSFVNKVARGGFFGGAIDSIRQINGHYYHILQDTLTSGFMGADECIYTIMCYIHSNLISEFNIKGDGLVWPFFENLKKFTNKIFKPEPEIERENFTIPEKTQPIFLDERKTALYVLTYNSPDQLSTLIKSFHQVPGFLDGFSEKYIIDNSLKTECFGPNLELAMKNNFSLIKKDNLGICGGRQFVAEHFSQIESEYMIFFEDDMFLNPPSEKGFCKNGFKKYIDNILGKSINIMLKHKFDFLKWSFTEFFGDNKTQWAWYNVPQAVRSQHWPDNHTLPEQGLSPNAPLVHYSHIHLEEDLPYASGECYYCNWPVMVSKNGNKKMFLDTKWGRPYEQTWMSHIFQETIKGNIKSAILLASPITHDRFIHYPQEERKES